MIISSLRLRDFLVHEDSEIEFKEGLNVITGENGSGKSSIIQAIYYALFGKSLYYDNVKQFLRFNKNDFYVKLEFNTNGG
ncbi:MAG: AAA family ATPase, partial [candidate division WOR-3 bacterium]